MTTELEHVAQIPRDVTVGKHTVTIYPATINRLQQATMAAFGLLKTTESIDKAKAIGLQLYAKKLEEAGGDAAKINIDELKNEASQSIIDSIADLFVAAPPEIAKLMAIICRPNGMGAKTPEPFDKVEFWTEEATISEAVAVISAFVAGIDIAALLKNVRALKGVA